MTVAHEWAGDELDDALDLEFLGDEAAEVLDQIAAGTAWLEDGDDGKPFMVVVDHKHQDAEGEPLLRRLLRPGSILSRAEGDPVVAQQIAERYLWRRRMVQRQLEVDLTAIQQRIDRAKALIAYKQAKAQRTFDALDFFLTEYREEAYPGVEGTVKLEGGELRRDKNRDKIEWDETAAVAWALTQDEAEALVEIRKSAAKSKLTKRGREYVDENGEVVPFVRDVPPAEPFKLWVKQ